MPARRSPAAVTVRERSHEALDGVQELFEREYRGQRAQPRGDGAAGAAGEEATGLFHTSPTKRSGLQAARDLGIRSVDFASASAAGGGGGWQASNGGGGGGGSGGGEDDGELPSPQHSNAAALAQAKAERQVALRSGVANCFAQLEAGNSREALKQSADVLEASLSNRDALHARIASLYAMGYFRAAARVIEEAMVGRPDDSQLLEMLHAVTTKVRSHRPYFSAAFRVPVVELAPKEPVRAPTPPAAKREAPLQPPFEAALQRTFHLWEPEADDPELTLSQLRAALRPHQELMRKIFREFSKLRCPSMPPDFILAPNRDALYLCQAWQLSHACRFACPDLRNHKIDDLFSQCASVQQPAELCPRGGAPAQAAKPGKGHADASGSTVHEPLKSNTLEDWISLCVWIAQERYRSLGTLAGRLRVMIKRDLLRALDGISLQNHAVFAQYCTAEVSSVLWEWRPKLARMHSFFSTGKNNFWSGDFLTGWNEIMKHFDRCELFDPDFTVKKVANLVRLVTGDPDVLPMVHANNSHVMLTFEEFQIFIFRCGVQLAPYSTPGEATESIVTQLVSAVGRYVPGRL